MRLRKFTRRRNTRRRNTRKRNTHKRDTRRRNTRRGNTRRRNTRRRNTRRKKKATSNKRKLDEEQCPICLSAVNPSGGYTKLGCCSKLMHNHCAFQHYSALHRESKPASCALCRKVDIKFGQEDEQRQEEASAARAAQAVEGPDSGLVRDDTLPEGWAAHISRRTGETYYFNTVTQESTYDHPAWSALASQGARDARIARAERLQGMNDASGDGAVAAPPVVAQPLGEREESIFLSTQERRQRELGASGGGASGDEEYTSDGQEICPAFPDEERLHNFAADVFSGIWKCTHCGRKVEQGSELDSSLAATPFRSRFAERPNV
jgi:hypothetical protein